jgi:MoxR-like ATPase
VILFDEIEKTHPYAFNLFLQILGDGRLTNRPLSINLVLNKKIALFKNRAIFIHLFVRVF